MHVPVVHANGLGRGGAGGLLDAERPNQVTGKRVKLVVNRYYLPHAGKVAVVDLGTPAGRGQRRRVLPDGDEPPVEIRSLYREPEARPTVTAPALELNDVFRIFRSGDVETVALRGLSLRVEWCEVVAVFGPSGSGKSTFMHLAAGLDVPSAGDVRAFGRSLTRLGDDELARYRARDVAIVFQSDNLWPVLTAHENVVSALRLRRGARCGGPSAHHARGSWGSPTASAIAPAELSGGEQQRVAIASAAARRAPLVLADEPTGELDLANERIVLDALLRLRDEFESTVVIVTHSPRVAEAVDRVIEIQDGRAVA